MVKWSLLAATLLLGGCGDTGPETFRFGLKSAPITLDPRFATDAASTRVNRLLYRQLVDFDEQFKPLPSLAGLGTSPRLSVKRRRHPRPSPFRWHFRCSWFS